jgi:hypothetical protein
VRADEVVLVLTSSGRGGRVSFVGCVARPRPWSLVSHVAIKRRHRVVPAGPAHAYRQRSPQQRYGWCCYSAIVVVQYSSGFLLLWVWGLVHSVCNMVATASS